MTVTVFTCSYCGADVSEVLGPVGKPDEVAPAAVRCRRCGRAPADVETEAGWIAYQHDRAKKFYCCLDHLHAHDPGLAYGAMRTTKQDFRNLDREGHARPPIRCTWPECSRLIYGKRLVLTTGPGELAEPFVVWVEEIWVDGANRMIRVQGFIDTEEVARHLVEEHRLDPDFARQKAAEMRLSRKVVIGVGEVGP